MNKTVDNRVQRLLIGLALVALLNLSVVAPATAQTPTDTPGAWQFEFTPYLWGAGLDGDVKVGRAQETDVEASFSDVWDNLDAAFMGVFEARNGRWAFLADAVYVDLKDDEATPRQVLFDRVEVEVNEQIYTLAAAYQVSDGPALVDVLGGARYTRLDVDLDLTSGLLPGRSRSGDESWWDPIVGVRALYPFANHWSLVGYADIGGFGAGSDFTWQLIAGVNYQFSKTWVGKFGFRYLSADYEEDNFKWDVATAGPYLGLGIRF